MIILQRKLVDSQSFIFREYTCGQLLVDLYFQISDYTIIKRFVRRSPRCTVILNLMPGIILSRYFLL